MIEYLTDRDGNRIKAVVPTTMLSSLVEFWCAARRAQTADIEASARPGMFRTSLAGLLPAGFEIPTTTPPSSKSDLRWSALLDRLPASATPDSPSEVITPNESRDIKRKPAHMRQTFFAREFISPPPEEVIQAINKGVYFLHAWRDYRKLTRKDVAELMGKTVDTINWHENGYTRPTAITLARFADIFDCPVEQLTVRPDSNTQPWLTLISNPDVPQAPKELRPEPTSPEETDYPDAVLAHLLDGKAPLTAWRLFRGLTLSQLGERYGSSPGNIRQMEAATFLRPKSIAKLCPILKCKPEQLLRPEGLTIRERDESPESRRIKQVMRAHA
ncbi:helix-turn-helix transcriptional regulator [Paraburkholderia sp. MM5477-R1]|uniref:helix-turn-helix transcriptional regulator n=1 Tax=Paraburkholderia sp. MM5477-R1 TaxID=2991062 RepID=UPI003D2390C8